MSNKDRTPEVDTALHIIKGAIVKVLHTPLTTTTASKKNEGRLTVEYDQANDISPIQLKQIEELCNQKIKENVPVIATKMDRAEAEKKFQDRVNETFIYDKLPVPAKITEVSVLHIENWNVNCCAGTHVNSTGLVGGIKVMRANHRPNKKELEFVFEVTPPSKEPDPSAITVPVKKPVVQRYDDVSSVTDKILALVLDDLKAKNVDLGGKEEAIKASLHPQILHNVVMLKNHAYASGFSSQPTHTTML